MLQKIDFLRKNSYTEKLKEGGTVLANYHTHTWRCNHAVGSEREYIEKAIDAGIEILGFSDHTPNPFSWNINDGIRMLPEQTKEYFDTITALRREYAGKIEIHAGVEVEYIPGEFCKLQAYLQDFGCEYLIMGQHYVDGVYVRFIPEDAEKLHGHIDQILDGLSTGAFLYLAHPDLFVWDGPEQIYLEEMTRLCHGVKALGIPMEYNLLGLRSGRNYPEARFWRIAAEVGNTVILGIDAHQSDDMIIGEVERQALENLKELGITPIKTVKL